MCREPEKRSDQSIISLVGDYTHLMCREPVERSDQSIISLVGDYTHLLIILLITKHHAFEQNQVLTTKATSKESKRSGIIKRSS